MLAGVFIDDVAYLDGLAFPVRVELEVQSPHMPWVISFDLLLGAYRGLETFALAARRNPQVLRPPQAADGLTTSVPAFGPGTFPCPSIAPTVVLFGELDQPFAQASMLVRSGRLAGQGAAAAVRTSRKPGDPAGYTLCIPLGHEVMHSFMPPVRV